MVRHGGTGGGEDGDHGDDDDDAGVTIGHRMMEGLHLCSTIHHDQNTV